MLLSDSNQVKWNELSSLSTIETFGTLIQLPLEVRLEKSVSIHNVLGGVAEMLPRVVSLMNELGFCVSEKLRDVMVTICIKVSWLTINTTNEQFFTITKKIHNNVHGSGRVEDFTSEDRDIFERVNRENAETPGFLDGSIILEGDFICKFPQIESVQNATSHSRSSTTRFGHSSEGKIWIPNQDHLSMPHWIRRTQCPNTLCMEFPQKISGNGGHEYFLSSRIHTKLSQGQFLNCPSQHFTLWL